MDMNPDIQPSRDTKLYTATECTTVYVPLAYTAVHIIPEYARTIAAGGIHAGNIYHSDNQHIVRGKGAQC